LVPCSEGDPFNDRIRFLEERTGIAYAVVLVSNGGTSPSEGSTEGVHFITRMAAEIAIPREMDE
jgi:hypothetical protein